jgi:DNA-binding MarR family transcriptional regulator
MSSGRLFGLLRVAFDQSVHQVLVRVAPDHPDLRPAHVLIFRHGGIEGSHVTELAAHAGMTKQSMHEVVTHLEKAGYLRRSVSPEAPRARVVELTERGRRLEAQVHEAIAEVVDDWVAKVGAQRLDALWHTLAEITGELALTPGRTDAGRSAGRAVARHDDPTA